MPTFDLALEALELAKQEWSERLIRRDLGRVTKFSTGSSALAENVVGVGIGEKESEGKPTGDPSLKFFVVRKLAKSSLSEAF